MIATFFMLTKSQKSAKLPNFTQSHLPVNCSTMLKITLSILLFIGLSVTSLAQSTLANNDDILLKYNQLNHLKDENEKLFQLNELADEWMTRLSDSTYVFPSCDTLDMQHIANIGNKYDIYYFTPTLTIAPPRIELFIKYMKDTSLVILHFTEVVKIPVDKEGMSKPQSFNIEPVTRIINNTEFYQLNVSANGIQFDDATIPDVTLKCWFEEVLKSQDDDQKIAINNQIVSRLNTIFSEPALYLNTFKNLNRVSTILSPDKKVKLSTWSVQLTNLTNLFFGTVIRQSPDGKIITTPLIDKTAEIKNPERPALSPKKWYGAVYIDIIETSYKKQTYYTLIGFKPNDEFTRKKVLETMTINEVNNDIKFGHSIINKGPGNVMRSIYEYSASGNMMLRYDADRKMIVMDNLAPSSPAFKDVYRTYGPDFSYNGYKFEKGKWIFYPDIDVRNPKTPERTYQHKKGGLVIPADTTKTKNQTK